MPPRYSWGLYPVKPQATHSSESLNCAPPYFPCFLPPPPPLPFPSRVPRPLFPATLSLSGSGAFPMAPRYSWGLFFVPSAWLVASGGWPQPRDRFLQVSLLLTFLLMQVKCRDPI